MEEHIKKAVNQLFNKLDNLPPDTHEEYLSKLKTYKGYVDDSPNKFLKFHLDTALKLEQYELAQHIKDVAESRNFELMN